MIHSLPLFHRIAGQPVIVLGEGEAAEAKRRLVERAGGLVVTEMQQGIDRGARLAFVAHDDPGAMESDAIRLRSAGLLVNVVDRPDLCDFTAPSILDRSPVLIAIATGGASAGLAKALRLRLEALLPPGLGRLAEALSAARARLRTRWPDPGDRRRALDAALAQGGPLDPLSADAATCLDDWLAGAAVVAGTVVELRLRSPDPDDLTLREARLLGSADVLAHEPLVPAAVVERARADAVRLPIEAGALPPERAGLVVVLRF
ncbi:MAG: siroheme synthase [Sphingomonadales bacterium]|nr:siroheme synthase [Sphingomonadales bacterium]